MSVKLFFRPETEKDIAEAFEWYQHQRIGLGEEYLSCVDACIERIARMPESYPEVYMKFRRALIRRFPYAVFYEFDGTDVIVYSIFHNSRDPQKWKKKI
jgi:plasmid stabilization system protein ParE